MSPERSNQLVRAVGVRQFGGPEALEVLELPSEVMGPTQLRLRVTAAAVNPSDTRLRVGRFSSGQMPTDGVAVPGMDVAAVVTEIGRDATTDLRIGDEVMGIVLPSGAHGAYREDLVLPARSVTRIPKGATMVEAATLPMNGLTAFQALDVLQLNPGQVLAVTGAAGALGGYVMQLAKVAGLTVIGDASSMDAALVRDLGADIVVSRGPDVATRIREHFPNGVDGLVDGAVQGAAVLPAVRDGGAVATVRGYTGDEQRGVRVQPVSVRIYAEEFEKLDRLRQLAERGEITLRVAGTYSIEQAAAAHRRLEAGGTRGRLVLLFD